MKKIYILDTSAILSDPYILTSLEDNTIIIPEVVLDELDGKKDRKDEKGYNSREATRILDKLIEAGKDKEQSLLDGVSTPGEGILKVELNHTKTKMPESWTAAPNDNRILQVCKAYTDDLKKGQVPVILITKDKMLKVKAEALGVRCEEYKKESVAKLDQQYKGVLDLTVPAEVIDIIYAEKSFTPGRKHAKSVPIKELEVNQFIILRDEGNTKRSAVAICDGKSLNLLQDLDGHKPSGINPRNLSQKIMTHALKQKAADVPLVILKGPAGTAKTLLALAAGLDDTLQYGGYHPGESSSYRKLLICRTSTSMGEDLGYLPGGEQEKLAPYMRPIRDNLEVIVQAMAKGTKDKEQLKKESTLKDKVDEYFKGEIINIEAVGFLRGRSISQQYVIIDEAQNATPSQIKSIITRIGEGTKLILCGDPEQIDHPYLDERTNGLSVAAEMMKGSPLCMQYTLTEDDCVRSALAKEAIGRFSGVK